MIWTILLKEERGILEISGCGPGVKLRPVVRPSNQVSQGCFLAYPLVSYDLLYFKFLGFGFLQEGVRQNCSVRVSRISLVLFQVLHIDNGRPWELFTLPHLFLPDSYWTPGLLLDFTRTPANFILADHHTNLVSQSYWSPSKFLLESLGIADS